MPRGAAYRGPVKVLLRDRDGDTESIWCQVVDEARGLYRVDNIPFLRTRPTYGDVIVATPDREGSLSFRRVHERGGLRSAALEYRRKATFRPLVAWLKSTYGIVAEGLVGPRRGAYGLLALAVPRGVSPSAAIAAASAKFADVRRSGAPPRPPGASSTETAALHEAIAAGDRARVRAAIASGAKLDRRHGDAGDTALIAACKKGDRNAVRSLLAAGARVDPKNDFGQSAAHWAVRKGDVPLLRLLAAEGAEVVTREASGTTGLHFAVAEGHVAMVKELLRAGADVNGRRNRFRGAPLHGAAKRDRAAIARLLIAAGARTDLRDRAGFTPLMDAAYRGSTSTARVIAAHASRKDLGQALVVAADEGSLPLVRLLVRAGADVAHRSPRGRTALAVAKEKKRGEVVAYLTSREASVPP